YYGGIVDDLIMWFITTINSIPSLFLLLIFAALFDPGPLGLILVLGFLGWTGTTRLVRGETFSLREREFVISARAAGATDLRIMFVHILPNLISIVVVTLAIDIGVLILVESGLSYLGLGVPPPTPSWGNMLTDSQSF
ncbi:MAG: peptide ABC transporter permease, partial [Phototrophicales bacterium]